MIPLGLRRFWWTFVTVSDARLSTLSHGGMAWFWMVAAALALMFAIDVPHHNAFRPRRVKR